MLRHRQVGASSPASMSQFGFFRQTLVAQQKSSKSVTRSAELWRMFVADGLPLPEMASFFRERYCPVSRGTLFSA
jgi:hypothetical protein